MRHYIRLLGIALFLSLLVPIHAQQGQESEPDMEKAWELRVKKLRGGTLTPEEIALIQRVDAYRRKFWEVRKKQRQGDTLTPEEDTFLKRALESRRKNTEAYRKVNPPRESTGRVPLTELGKNTYKGQEGGLYPGGRNTPPEPHLKAGLAQAGQIVPRNGAGEPSEGGKIVLLSIGMSNTTQEFRVFKKVAERDSALHPNLVIVDGAQGGQSAELTRVPEARYWKFVDGRMGEANVTAKQVQAVWIKQAIQRPQRPFPVEAKTLQNDLVANLHILAGRFPNLKIAYLSSRIYAGYTNSPLNPEPFAYEDGFAIKWLIADQMAGNSELNYDPTKGTVRSPWLAWGPYLWADGITPRSDGLTYTREDLAGDGTHPSASGQEKVANLILTFLKNDPTARPWFLSTGTARALGSR